MSHCLYHLLEQMMDQIQQSQPPWVQSVITNKEFDPPDGIKMEIREEIRESAIAIKQYMRGENPGLLMDQLFTQFVLNSLISFCLPHNNFQVTSFEHWTSNPANFHRF